MSGPGPNSCGIIAPPYVVSVSYGQDEASVTAKYANRQCTEYAKVSRSCSLSYFSHTNSIQLGMMGTSVLYSSGDYGVAGGGGVCLDSQGLSFFISFNFLIFYWVFLGQVSQSGTRFNPSFPVGNDQSSQTIPSKCVS